MSKIVTKLNQIREKKDNKLLTELLEKTEYFKRLVYDTQERKELIEHASKYMKYKYYPKGTLIYDYSTLPLFSKN